MKLLLVVNPASGRSDTLESLHHIEAYLSDNKIKFSVFKTTGKNDAGNLSKKLTAYRPSCVAACGGDGTIQLAAAALAGKGIPLGIIPLGSANGMAHALSIPKQHDQALKLILQAPRKKSLDLIRINEHTCIHLSDIGTNALLIKNYEEAGDKGKIGYAKHLLSSIRESELMDYAIVTPKGTFQKQGYMLVIANANQYGTGVRISDGSVSDGQFEICNVEEITLSAAVKAGLTALNVFVDKNMFSDVIRCAKAEIKINRPVHLQVDGEYHGEVDHIVAEIIPGALTVIVPS